MSDAVVSRDMAQPGTRVRPRAGRRLLLASGLVVLAVAGAWYGNRWWNELRFIESTDDAYVGGNVTAIGPHVAGFVKQVLVADNEHVAAGQLLVRLDDRDYQAALNRAEAIVGARMAAVDGLRAQLVLQQSTIRQQEADLTAKTAHAAFSSEDAARYRSLAQTSAGSRQDMQRTATLDTTDRAAVASAAAGLESARQQVNVLNARIAEATAALAQARAELETARLNLEYTELRAPIDGYVGNRAAQVGAYAASGSYLISIVPDSGLWVDANFKEDQLAGMRPGQTASVAADVLPGHEFAAHLVTLAPGTGATFSVIPPENATGNFTKIVQRVPVRIVLDGNDPALRMLRPGLSTTVRVDTRRRP